MLASDLRAWLQLLDLDADGEPAKAMPKILRYRFLEVPAVLVRGQPRRRPKIPRTWPWAKEIVRFFPGCSPAPPDWALGTHSLLRAEGRHPGSPPDLWNPAPSVP